MRPLPHPTRSSTGFSLAEMAVVLVIIGLLTGILVPLATAMQDQQRRKETAAKLAAIDQALLSYVATNRRLPCPANGTIASGAANAGVAQPLVGDCTAMTNGVVPWVTLGLSETEATDAWGARMTYRVPDLATGFTRANALDASRCDPAGAAARVAGGAGADSCAVALCAAATVASCTSPVNFLVNRGLIVNDEGGVSITNPATATGAAYIVISHGKEGGGGYSSNGALIASGVAAGTNEAFNQNGNAIRLSPNGYFRDSRLIEIANTTHFDDLVSHPTVMSVLSKAQLAPRAQP